MSIFYASRFARPFSVPILAFQRLAQLRQVDTDCTDALLMTLRDCVGLANPTKEQVDYFLHRIESACADQTQGAVSEASDQLTRGTHYREFLQSLSIDRTLLLMCAGDYVRAEYLYCQVDRDDVLQMVADFRSEKLEANEYMFESVLYAMGGSYKGDEPGDDDDMDLTGADAATITKFLMN